MPRRRLALFVVLILSASIARAESQVVTDFPWSDYSIAIGLDRDGGRELVEALRTKPPRASALDALLRHGYTDEALAVLSRIVAADDSELLPGLMAAARSQEWWMDQRRRDDITTALGRMLDAAAIAAQRRPRDEGADIAREIVRLRRNSRSKDAQNEALRAFVHEYDGTTAAALAQLDLTFDGLGVAQRVEAAERFAREHEGTVAGARALHQAGFDLASNYAITGVEPRGSDPTARLVRVAAISRELESGRFPPCEWVTGAPMLIAHFFVSQRPAPSYADGNVQRSLDVYAEFVRTHLTWTDPYPPNDSIGSMVSGSMWSLWTLQGDPFERAERFFDELASDESTRDAARSLQARTYLLVKREEASGSTPFVSRAISLMGDLARDGVQPFRRQAHAALAAQLQVEGDNQRACTEFARFIAAYPRSDWAWVASLRMGQCAEALQQWQQAADTYRHAADTYADTPAAVLLGHAYAARALEGAGDFQAALDEYESAIARWYGKDSLPHALSLWQRLPTKTVVSGRDENTVLKNDLEGRRDQLRATLSSPGGVLFERARWALLHNARGEARGFAGALTRQFPRSPLIREARVLARTADYEDALDLAAADNPRDLAGARARLAQLSSDDSHDVIASLALIARASMMEVERTAGSDSLMKKALERWRSIQLVPPAAAPGTLEADADAVRRTVFMPLGGGVFGRHWNAMEWPTTLPPFLIAPATLPVQEFNGRQSVVAASRPISGLENTLYLSREESDLLARTMVVLGGSLVHVTGSIMATPNQPAGAAETITKLWNRFFPMRAGHWGGWEFATYPVIQRIEFTNAERTRAAVPVTIGYSGGTVLLEKIDGNWRVVQLVGQWIT